MFGRFGNREMYADEYTWTITYVIFDVRIRNVRRESERLPQELCVAMWVSVKKKKKKTHCVLFYRNCRIAHPLLLAIVKKKYYCFLKLSKRHEAKNNKLTYIRRSYYSSAIRTEKSFSNVLK